MKHMLKNPLVAVYFNGKIFLDFVLFCLILKDFIFDHKKNKSARFIASSYSLQPRQCSRQDRCIRMIGVEISRQFH